MSKDNRTPQGSLKQGMTLVDIVAIGLGAAIGVSIFAVIQPAARVAGPGALISLLIAALPMAIFVVVYSFMGSAVPRSGASFDWPTQFVHPTLGFMVTWIRILAYAGILNMLTLVLVNYLSVAIRIPRRPFMFLLLLIFYLLNLFGIRIAARTERFLVFLKILAFAVFVFVGIRFIKISNFTPLAPFGTWSILAAVPLLVGLYSGIETATDVGEEIKNSSAVIGRGLTIAAALGLFIAIATTFVALGVVGAPNLAESRAPLLDAGKLFLGRWNNPLMLATATLAICTSLNAAYLVFSRFLFAMGRDRALPVSLAKIHPAWGTPYVSITVVFIFGVLGLLLPSSLVFLFLAINIPSMLKYFSNCLSASRLVDHYPELHRGAKFKLSRKAVKAWSYSGMICAIVIIVAGLSADWRPYAALGAWAIIGAAYWTWRGRHVSSSMQKRRG
jgi:APA family basic amino acid/polyamine antiporter